jgi:hypothetical protein
MRGFLHELVGPIDPYNLEATLESALEKKDKERAVIQVDPFFKACQL